MNPLSGSKGAFLSSLHPEKITPDHQKVLSQYFQTLNTIISELSFEGLFLFSEYYNYKLCCIQNLQCILGQDRGGDFIISPFGTIQSDTMKELFSLDIYLKLVSYRQLADYKKNLSPETAKIIGNRDDFDYIFKRSDLEHLSGRKYHKKRNNIAQFLGLYNNIKIEDLSNNNLGDIFHIINIWEGEKKEENSGKDDYSSVVKMIEYFEALNLFGKIYYINDEPAAFVVGEMRRQNTCCVIFFQKAQKKFKGIYQFINREFVSQLPHSCTMINLEQDLGIEGLRQAKETYRPRAYLRKYRIAKHD